MLFNESVPGGSRWGARYQTFEKYKTTFLKNFLDFAFSNCEGKISPARAMREPESLGRGVDFLLGNFLSDLFLSFVLIFLV